MLYCSYVKMHKGALTMKIKYLLMGTSLSLIPQTINAQCVATQDCATLGYTETSCSGGSGVKCPFGNYWACFKTDAEFCNEYGFSLACSGNGYAGGTSKACNGKYVSCNCASGYAWNASSKKCEYDYKTNCTIGALYYSDGTCSDKLETSKTLLGVVIYEKTDKEDGWIMAVGPFQSVYWGMANADIPGLSSIETESDLTDIQDSCTNTDLITNYGSNSNYPAAWTAKNYRTAGTPAGKSWCLPSGGLLNKALNNSVNFARINAGMLAAGKDIIGYFYGNYDVMWSSSKRTNDFIWRFRTNFGATDAIFMETGSRGNYSVVRPVMAF